MRIVGLRKRPEGLAFDRASVRKTDQDGRLHIAVTNISKATVNPYLGSEIPGWPALGLNPNRAYYMLRCPIELDRGAASFNNIPILSVHQPVSARTPAQEIVIGSTGTDAEFVDPYLRNSAVVWVADEIDQIEDETKREWSCGYYYRADMRPGEFMGLRYDGVMRDIVGNHVALVDEGRAGPDVMVGDILPGALKMAVLNSRRALMLSGAVTALIAPKMATDKKVDLSGILTGDTTDRAKLATAIVAAVTPSLAQDAALASADVEGVIAAVDASEVEGPDAIPTGTPAPTPTPTPPPAPTPTPPPAPSPTPAPTPTPAPAPDPAAMAADVNRRVVAIREAERAVAPLIGAVTVAQDSAEAVYKLALDAMKVDTAGVHPSAYKSLVAMKVEAQGAGNVKPPVVMDRATVATDFKARFPNARAPLAI